MLLLGEMFLLGKSFGEDRTGNVMSRSLTVGLGGACLFAVCASMAT